MRLLLILLSVFDMCLPVALVFVLLLLLVIVLLIWPFYSREYVYSCPAHALVFGLSLALSPTFALALEPAFALALSRTLSLTPALDLAFVIAPPVGDALPSGP